MRQYFKTDIFHHAIFFEFAFSVNPLSFILGLARAAIQSGAQLFDKTRAISIEKVTSRSLQTSSKMSFSESNRKYQIKTESESVSGMIYGIFLKKLIAYNYNDFCLQQIMWYLLPISILKTSI